MQTEGCQLKDALFNWNIVLCKNNYIFFIQLTVR